LEIAFLPYGLLRIFRVKKEDMYHWNILISNLLLVILFAFSGWWFTIAGKLPHFCLFRRITGLDCPFCGLTSGMVHLFHGEPGLAWLSNRISIALLLYLVIQVLLRAFFLLYRTVSQVWLHRFSRVATLVFLTIAFINWIYNLIDIYL